MCLSWVSLFICCNSLHSDEIVAAVATSPRKLSVALGLILTLQFVANRALLFGSRAVPLRKRTLQ